MELVQFLTNRETQFIMSGGDNLGCNWYTWSRHLGTQLIQFLHRGTQLVLTRPGHSHPEVWVYSDLLVGLSDGSEEEDEPRVSLKRRYTRCVRKVMTLNAWLDNWQSCSHTLDTSRDIHSYLMISASFNSIALTRLIWQRVV